MLPMNKYDDHPLSIKDDHYNNGKRKTLIMQTMVIILTMVIMLTRVIMLTPSTNLANPSPFPITSS